MRDNRGMSTTPGPADGSASARPVPPSPADDPLETVTRADAVVRRAPKYTNFLLLGALVGLVAAMALTFAFADWSEDAEYTIGQVFGFLLVGLVPIGIGLFGFVAWIIDRTTLRRARTVPMSLTVRETRLEEQSAPDAPSASRPAPSDAAPDNAATDNTEGQQPE